MLNLLEVARALQPLDKEEHYQKPAIEQKALNSRLIDWARTLPSSSCGILDFASGPGLEVKVLRDAGFSCLGIDLSDLAVQYAVTPGAVKKGDITARLDESPESYGGVVFLDGFIWFSRPQRRRLMKQAYRILVPGGEMFIRSENLDTDRVIVSNAQADPPNLQLFRHALLSDKAWNKTIQEKLAQGYKLKSAIWSFSSQDIVRLAEDAGFEVTELEEFSADHPLVRESRWSDQSGLIAKLRKRK